MNKFIKNEERNNKKEWKTQETFLWCGGSQQKEKLCIKGGLKACRYIFAFQAVWFRIGY